MYSQLQTLDLYEDDDYQNLMMDCYQENKPIILENKKQEKMMILKEIGEFLLYEDYLLNCYLKSNKPTVDNFFDSQIQIYKLDKQKQTFEPFNRQKLSMKKYFTIGNNTSLKNNELEINEIAFNDAQVELIHLEVNYEDLLLPINNKNNMMEQLNKRINESDFNISSKIKQKIVSQRIADDDNQLKVKNAKKQYQQYPMIDVNSYAEYSKLKLNRKFKLGGGDWNRNILQILEINSCFEILPKEQSNINYQIRGTNYSIEYLKNNQQEQEIKMILQSPAIKLKNDFDDYQYILIANQKNEFSIGRSSSNDIQTEDKNISRNHCLIRYLQNQQFLGEWEIMDLQSAQGTWLLMQDDSYYKIDNMTRIRVGSNIVKLEFLNKEENQCNNEQQEDENENEEDLTESLLQL
ncbi:unnamed protein product [Paramecium pentaurelia]|uniref:FHA domain-containing protein n=1 Tax=Paramecium pentaurelia TaxID=43138 RepID=A0A8S1WIY7_9CILI|nr:unnamed protein product [Paramecium pentaurelia]